MVKVIAFSLWGNIQTYCIGCIRNVIIAEHLFKDWEVWVYYNDTVPRCVVKWLAKRPNTRTIRIDDNDTSNSFKTFGQQGSIWRLYPLSDPNVEVMLCRDTDSRLSYYEYLRVTKWLEEGKTDAHTMVDQFERNAGKEFRACSCAFKRNGRDLNISKMVNDTFQSKTKLPFYCDEDFLNKILIQHYQGSITYEPRGVRDKIGTAETCDLFTVFIGDVLDEYNVKLNKYTNHAWEKSRLNDRDDHIIQELIKDDEQKMINFMKKINN